MTKILALINTTAAAILAPIAVALGGWDVLLQVLVWFMVIDYMTGVINAICSKRLSSEVGFKGLFRKLVIFALVFVAVQLDNATGSTVFRSLTILFYVSNEGISILENIGKLGVPYPKQLQDILIQIKKRSESTTTEEEGKPDGK